MIATKPTELAVLAQKHGTDKEENSPIYESYLGRWRDEPVKLLEIGIGGDPFPATGGSSLRMWRDFFQNGSIHAIDINDKSPHAEDRVHVYRGSQNDTLFLKSVAERIGKIDVIVDDGSHFSSHVITSFQVLFPYLASGGLYIVEDIGTSYWPDFEGSTDPGEPSTSMNYFKRAVDGIQWPNSRGAVTQTPLFTQLEFVHFWLNFIVLKKR